MLTISQCNIIFMILMLVLVRMKRFFVIIDASGIDHSQNIGDIILLRSALALDTNSMTFGCVCFIANNLLVSSLALLLRVLAFDLLRILGSSLQWLPCAIILVPVLFRHHDIDNTLLTSGQRLDSFLFYWIERNLTAAVSESESWYFGVRISEPFQTQSSAFWQHFNTGEIMRARITTFSPRVWSFLVYASLATSKDDFSTLFSALCLKLKPR